MNAARTERSNMEAGKIMQLLLLLFISAAAFMDNCTKKIPLMFLAAGFGAGVLLQILFPGKNAVDLLGGCMVGAALVLLAWVTRQQIGYGDGLLFAVTGIFLGFFENLLLLVASLFPAAFFAGVLFLKKKKKGYRFPFVPFVLIGYVLLLGFE